MSEPIEAPAQTNPDAAAPVDAAPVPAAPAEPAAPAAPAPAADIGVTALTAGAPPAPPAEPATPPATPDTPVDYTALMESLTLPEGVPESMAFDATEKSVIKDIAEQAKLSPEQAKVVHDVLIKNRVDDRQALERQVQEWKTELQKDPQLSGEDGSKWATTQANIDRAFQEFGSPEIGEFFKISGMGYHKMFVKLFAAVGERIAPDSTKAGNQPPVAESQKPQDVLYKDM